MVCVLLICEEREPSSVSDRKFKDVFRKLLKTIQEKGEKEESRITTSSSNYALVS